MTCDIYLETDCELKDVDFIYSFQRNLIKYLFLEPK